MGQPQERFIELGETVKGETTIRRRASVLVQGIVKAYKEAAATNDMGLVRLLNEDLARMQNTLADMIEGESSISKTA